MSIVLPENVAEFELSIMHAAEQHEEKSRRSDWRYHRFFHHDDNFSVKYSDHVSIVQECTWLQHLYSIAIKGGDAAPHVPQVLHYFRGPNGWGFIVMERIYLRSVSDAELCRQTAKAVQWMLTQRMDPSGSIGGGGNTSHTVFQGGSAPEAFTGVAAVQNYLNVAVSRVQRRQAEWMTPVAEFDFVGEDVVLTQSDMHPTNFGVAASDGRPVIFDAATIQALPRTLACFTLLCTSQFAKSVSIYVIDPSERAALLESPSFLALTKVRTSLIMGNDNLGVDKNGVVRKLIRPSRIGRQMDSLETTS